jgi:hypothetical protein
MKTVTHYGANCNPHLIGVTLKVMKLNPSAKNVIGNSENFTSFMRRLVSVPHAEIKAKLDAEKEAKRTPRSASRASVAPTKPA